MILVKKANESTTLHLIKHFFHLCVMRIAINARLLLHDKLEGIGRHAYELISRLILLHPEHEFILFYDRRQDIIVPPGAQVRAVSLYPVSRHPLLLWYWTEISLKKALIKYQADLYYSPEPILPDNLLIPSIITIHDISPLVLPDALPWDHRFYYQYILKRNIRKATHLITVSDFSKKEIIKHYGVGSQKIEILSNAAGINVRPSPLSILPEYPYFISISSIHDRKNVDLIIKAFDLFKSKYKTNHQLVLAGRRMGKHDKFLHSLAQSPNKKDILETGYLSEEKKVQLLAFAAALINLSEYEGFGIQLVEAFQTGVPVIAADRSCYPEITQGAALLVNPTDSLAVAEAMSTSLIDPGTMIQKGLMRAKDFDWLVSAKKLSALIHRSFS